VHVPILLAVQAAVSLEFVEEVHVPILLAVQAAVSRWIC
jgi:hypothetical protein